MKKLLLTLFCLCLSLSVNAETIKDFSYKNPLKEHNFPIMYDYFYNYAEDLMYKYDPKIYPYPGYFISTCFNLSKKGKIDFWYKSLFVSIDGRKSRSFVKKNRPEKFSDGMEDEKIPVCVYMTTEDEDFADMLQFMSTPIPCTNDRMVKIMVHKSIKHKNMNKEKCKSLGYDWQEDKKICTFPYFLNSSGFNYDEIENMKKIYRY